MSSPVHRDIPCRSVDCYQRLNYIDEGTYGLVFRARDIATGEIYALKHVKSDHDKQGFPVTALREISTLFTVSHPNIVNLREVVVTSTLNKVYLVLEYAQHDLLTVLDRMKRPYPPSELKSLMHQLLSGVAHLHRHWLLHRDLKPANILLTDDGILKICDFGLARYYADPPASSYTPGVVTLWYRAPELLLGQRVYSTAVDTWAVGCIFAELLLLRPLIDGKTELDHISKMAQLLGAPSEDNWEGFSDMPNSRRLSFHNAPKHSLLTATLRSGVSHLTDSTIDLISKLLRYDPNKRISAADALKHPYFAEQPTAKPPSLIQTFPNFRKPS